MMGSMSASPWNPKKGTGPVRSEVPSPFWARAAMPVDAGQFFFHELANILRRQSARMRLAEGLADPSADDVLSSCLALLRCVRRHLHAPAAPRRHHAETFQVLECTGDGIRIDEELL